MVECKNTCTFRLTKFRELKHFTCKPPSGKDSLDTDYIEKLVRNAAARAAKPNPDRVAENAKCGDGCRCHPVGKPEWETDENGEEKWHQAELSCKYPEQAADADTYTLSAHGEAVDGTQGGTCRDPKANESKYDLGRVGD